MTMNPESLTLAVRRARSDLDRQIGEHDAVLARQATLIKEIETLKADQDTYDKAAALLNSLGEERQDQTQRTIEQLVTQGLQTIFSDNLAFRMESSVKANRANIEFLITTTLPNGEVVSTPVLEARGGGIAATVGFLLRLVILLLGSRGETVLLLDETFSHVSAEYEPRLAEFMKDLVEKTGVQILLVTHSDAYSDSADRVVQFNLDAHGNTVVS